MQARILNLLCLLLFSFFSQAGWAVNQVSYDLSGTTDMGSTFTMSYTVDLDAAPFENMTDYVRWHPVSCSFTFNGAPYTGDTGSSGFVQDSDLYGAPSQPFHDLHCDDSTASYINVSLDKSGGFTDLSVAEAVSLPAVFRGGSALGEIITSVTVTENTGSNVVSYAVSGATDMGDSFTMNFSYDLTTAPYNQVPGDYAEWIPENCDFTINGTAYTGSLNHSFYGQTADIANPSPQPHSMLACDDGNGHSVWTAFDKQAAFSDVTVAEALELPGVLQYGSVAGATVISATLTETTPSSSVVTYDVSGTTDMGDNFTMSFTYDLAATPVEVMGSDYAYWRPLSCEFTINGTAYSGDVNNSDYAQDNDTYGTMQPFSALHCGDSAGNHLDVQLDKSSGFTDLGTAERVELPAVLRNGYVNGATPVSVTVTESSGGTTEGGLVSYQVTGTIGAGSYYTMKFIYDRDAAPVEVMMDSYTEYARWEPVRCSFTVNGVAYNGEPYYSAYIQDNDISNPSPPQPFSVLNCDTGDMYLSISLEKTGGFSALTSAEALDLPAVLVAGDYHYNAIWESVNSADVTDVTNEPEVVSYTLSGTTDVGDDFSMLFSYDLNAAPTQVMGNGYAVWSPLSCEFTINGTAYAGDMNDSNYMQDNDDSGYYQPFSDLYCGDGAGTYLDIRLDYPGGFANVGIAERLALLASLRGGSVNGAVPASVSVTQNNSSGGLVSYQISGTAGIDSYFTLDFSYDLDGVPVEVMVDSYMEHARWRPVRCRFTVDGVTYQGDPDMSGYIQDNDISVQTPSPFSVLNCDTGNDRSLSVSLEKTGSFDILTQAEALGLPAVLRSGDYLHQGMLDGVNTVEISDVTDVPEMVSYKMSGTTDTGSSFTVTLSYDLNAAPTHSYLNEVEGRAYWENIAECSFTLDGVSYTTSFSSYMQIHAGTDNANKLFCEDDNGASVHLDFGRPIAFTNFRIAEPLELPAMLQEGYVNGEYTMAVNVTDITDLPNIVNYEIIGLTDAGSYYTLSFAYDLHAAPVEVMMDGAMEHARWQPVRCSFTVNGTAYNGDPAMSAYFQDNDISNPVTPQPFNYLNCDTGNMVYLSVALEKAAGFNRFTEAETLDVPGVVRFGDYYNQGESLSESVSSADITDTTGVPDLVSYEISGNTDMGTPFSMSFSYDLNAAPDYIDEMYGQADWLDSGSCSFTIDGTAYTGSFSTYVQNSSYGYSQLFCDGGSMQMDLQLSKSGGFSDFRVAERLDIPATLYGGGLVNGEPVSGINITDTADLPNIVNYEITGTTDSGSDYTLSFAYDLHAAPLEVMMDGVIEYARWQPVRCSFTVDGTAYSGDPAMSAYFQDNDLSNPVTPQPFSYLNCDTGNMVHLSVELEKSAGFNRFTEAEALDVPGVFRYGSYNNQGEGASATVSSATVTDMTGVPDLVTYEISGDTDMGTAFTMTFSYDLNATPDNLDEVMAHWDTTSTCSFTLNSAPYTGNLSSYVQNGSSSYSELFCDAGNGVSLYLALAKSGGFSHLGIAERLELPAMLQSGSVNGENVMGLNILDTTTLPVASDVTVTGILAEGAMLTGSYSFSDGNGDSENGSTYQWVRADDGMGANAINIMSATAQTYTLAPDDSGKYVMFCVTPADGGQFGVETCSQLNGPVAAAPVMVSPLDNSTLSGSSVTFTWDGAGIQAWWLNVGSSPGSNSYFDSGALAGTTVNIQATGLPVDGRPVYVRLWYDNGGGWQSLDYTYTAATVTPEMLSPAAGSTLSGPDVTFTWQGDGVQAWWFYAGTAAGRNDYFNSGSLTTTSVQATGLPVDGSTVYVRLWYDNGGGWQPLDYTYTATTITPEMVSPVAGSTLSGQEVTFTWQGAGIQTLWLYAGNAAGRNNYFDSGNLGTASSVNVTGLPVNGSTVYVRLWYDNGSGMQYLDYTYTAATVTPEILSPVATLSGANVTFTWQGTGVQQWWLYIGTTLGTKNLYDSGSLTGATTSANVTGLPQNGSTVYARLWYNDGSGMWKMVDYTYTAAGGV